MTLRLRLFIEFSLRIGATATTATPALSLILVLRMHAGNMVVIAINDVDFGPLAVCISTTVTDRVYLEVITT